MIQIRKHHWWNIHNLQKHPAYYRRVCFIGRILVGVCFIGRILVNNWANSDRKLWERHWPYIGFAEEPLAMNSDLDLILWILPKYGFFIFYLIFFLKLKSRSRRVLSWGRSEKLFRYRSYSARPTVTFPAKQDSIRIKQCWASNWRDFGSWMTGKDWTEIFCGPSYAQKIEILSQELNYAMDTYFSLKSAKKHIF